MTRTFLDRIYLNHILNFKMYRQLILIPFELINSIQNLNSLIIFKSAFFNKLLSNLIEVFKIEYLKN